MSEGQMKIIMLTIKSENFYKWYGSLSDDDRVMYKMVFDSLTKS